MNNSEWKVILAICIIFSGLIGMLAGSLAESADIKFTYEPNSIEIHDYVNDEVYIYRSSDTSYVIVHPKLEKEE